MRILIADDSSVLRKMVAKIVERLEDETVELIEATSGTEALDIIGREGASIDMMLCDPGIPGTDGISVLEQVKADPAAKHIAVVVVTGDMSGKTVEKAKEKGAEAFLQKPFRKDDLVELIKKVQARS